VLGQPGLGAFDGRLHCVYPEPLSSEIMWLTYDPIGDEWSKPEPFGRGMKTRGAALAVLDDTLYCVHLGIENDLWWTRYDAATSTWAQDVRFGLGFADFTLWPPRLAVVDGVLHCSFTGFADAHIRWTTFDPASATWAPPRKYDFDCRSQDSPAILAVHPVTAPTSGGIDDGGRSRGSGRARGRGRARHPNPRRHSSHDR